MKMTRLLISLQLIQHGQSLATNPTHDQVRVMWGTVHPHRLFPCDKRQRIK